MHGSFSSRRTDYTAIVLVLQAGDDQLGIFLTREAAVHGTQSFLVQAVYGFTLTAPIEGSSHIGIIALLGGDYEGVSMGTEYEARV